MTWLPISLKNAAKCDKWYQLQNHSITESLNANGAWEKPPLAIPVHAVLLSVEQKPNPTEESWLVGSKNSRSLLAAEWLSRVYRQTVDSWVTQSSVTFVVFVCSSGARERQNNKRKTLVNNPTFLLQT